MQLLQHSSALPCMFIAYSFSTRIDLTRQCYRAISSSLYVSGIKGVMHQFHVSQTVALLGLTFYVVGLGCGPILAAPISETRGRLAVYRVCLPLFALFTMGAGLAPNFATIVVCRFFAGLFGGPTMSVIAGTNADIWHMSSRAPSSALMALSTAMGPGIGTFLLESILVWRAQRD